MTAKSVWRRPGTAGVIGALALVLAGCGGGSPASPGAATSAAPTSRTLTVFAAASLKGTFTELGERFETDHPGVTVSFNFGASSDLAQQIVNGGPADVFASASPATMKTVTDAGLGVAAPTVFVTNELQIAVAPGNPKGVTGFADLVKPGLKVVVCAPQVPCGAAEIKVEQATGIDVKPVSEEPDVKSTLGKVTTGDADAGLVYVTDVIDAKGTVTGVSFPESKKALNDYPIVVVKDAKQAELAGMFVELVRSEAGRKVLTAAGFGTP